MQGERIEPGDPADLRQPDEGEAVAPVRQDLTAGQPEHHPIDDSAGVNRHGVQESSHPRPPGPRRSEPISLYDAGSDVTSSAIRSATVNADGNETMEAAKPAWPSVITGIR
ncbi:hypothetical protein GCM10010151_08250 [Actinoallomurus spadix]|uniref:Uncharacterized protein n=1 Tax=Actinoallomurus spadix TaxID=79912 RepID=A0ABN0VZB5_9ACTN